jgi:hypothetical protein
MTNRISLQPHINKHLVSISSWVLWYVSLTHIPQDEHAVSMKELHEFDESMLGVRYSLVAQQHL